MEICIQSITKENIEKLIPEFDSLEYSWTEIGEIPWHESNYKLDLPGKWQLSLMASADGKTVGYAICSISDGIARLNKILVDREFRGKGLAKHLWDEFLARCRKLDISKIEFKAAIDNPSAIHFYRSRGCLFYGPELGTDQKARYNVKYVFRMNDLVRHSKPTISLADIESVAKALSEGNLMTGKVADEFLDTLKNYIGRDFGRLTINGASALHLALRALNISKDDQVIAPSYVCNSILNAIRYCGAEPIIVDINDYEKFHDYNISLEETRKKITDRTKAIILPHMFGQPITDLDAFLELSEKTGIFIIEDCALSIGSEYKGKKIGSFGHISIFSFYATKVMTSASGGAILTDDSLLFEKIDDLMTYDNRKSDGESYNYRMNDIQAALGLSQLKKLDFMLKARKIIARKYDSLLRSSSIDFELPMQEDNIFFRYIIRHGNAQSIIDSLKKSKINAEKPVPFPLHQVIGMQDSDFPNSVAAQDRSVSIPIYPTLKEQEIEDIAAILMNRKYESNAFAGEVQK